jgi:hypothetical protein
LWLIRYYKSPCSILNTSTLNHKFRLRNILHPLIWVSSRFHLSMWRSLSINVPSLKTPSPYFMLYHLYGRNDVCPTCLSSILKTCLSNIKFWYGVLINLACSFPFSKLSFDCLSITCQFTSKSNCHCKFWVTIRFILFHNSLFFRICRLFYIILTTSTA